MSRIIIYLILLLPTDFSDPPKSVTGSHIAFYSVLLRMGFTYALSVTRKAVVSYTALPPLPAKAGGIFLLHYPWSRLHRTCPAKPGLSSPGPFRSCQPRLFILLNTNVILTQDFLFVNIFYTSKHPPPINSRRSEVPGTASPGIPTK